MNSNLERYTLIIAHLKELQKRGVLTLEDYQRMEPVYAEKYGIEKDSIFRDISGYKPSLERICKQEDNDGN